MNLLRPSPLGDLHLHFLAIGIEKDELILVDSNLDRIANDQSFAGVSGAAPHAIGQFVPYGRNPRKNDDAVDRMAASIQEFGLGESFQAHSEPLSHLGGLGQRASGSRDPRAEGDGFRSQSHRFRSGRDR